VSDRVLVQVDGGVLTARLNRADKRNAIDRAMIDCVARGAGAGRPRRGRPRGGRARRRPRFLCGDGLERAARIRRSYPRGEPPSGAAICRDFRAHAPASQASGRGGAGARARRGCGLATACDLILAAESAQFGYPEVQRGFVPAIVMTMLRRTVGEKIAFDLATTGRLLDGTEAAALGLASRVYEDADFEEQAAEVLRVLRKPAPRRSPSPSSSSISSMG